VTDEERDERQPEADEADDAGRAEDAAAEGPVAAGREETTAEEPTGEEPTAEEPPGEEPAGADEAARAVDAAAEAPAERPERPTRRRGKKAEPEEEAIPGAHLEPDLVLEDEEPPAGIGDYAEAEVQAAEEALGEAEEAEESTEPAPVAREPVDLAADARYWATGKRKSAVARVTLRPGSGTYTINGRHLDEFFPRIKLQKTAKQPLEAAGYQSRMDVVARIHGGGVSSQAGALRHGIARALVEADPALRVELKRRGYLTRDPRVKERKKAGLKKARKRPQFSKR
jgi:small subunit ribosomal protein S9